MKIKKITYAAIIFLAGISTAQAQLINSTKGQAQTSPTADSTQQIGGMVGVNGAPKIGAIGDPGLGETAASQTYEVMLKACTTGFTGVGDEFTRKVYTRSNGTTFKEAFYLSKTGCVPDNRALEQKVAALENNVQMLGGEVIALKNPPTPIGGVMGTFATPFFTVTTSNNGGSTGAQATQVVCITGIKPIYSGNFTFWPEPNTIYPSSPGNPSYWAFNGIPYPGWIATGSHGGKPVGPLCPGGSYLHGSTAAVAPAQDRP